MNTKKTLALVLSAVMAGSCFAACSSGTSSSSGAGSESSQGGGTQAAQGSSSQQPAAADNGETVKLSYWLELAADKVAPIFKNYGEAKLWQEVESRLNVDIEFLHPPAGQAAEKFNLMVASMDLPDIFERDMNGYPGGPEKGIEDGIILKLNDIIAQDAPNLTKLMDEHPDWKKQWVTDDGTMYCFPFIRPDELLLTSWGPMMRKDWLEELGHELPTTIDEWETILTDMKAKGKCDYPFVLTNIGQFGDASSLPGAFGVGWEWYVDEAGVLQYGPLMPAFQDFIQRMADWYAKGLIDPDFTTNLDTQKFRAKVLNNECGAFFTNVGGGIGYLYDSINTGNGTLSKPKAPDGFAMTSVPFPAQAKGQKSRFGGKDWEVAGMTAYITPSCKNVSKAAELLDYGYGADGHTLFNFGLEGESFEYVDAATIDAVIDVSAIDPKYPKYTEAITDNPDQIMSLAMTNYMRSHMGGTFDQDVRYLLQYLPYDDQTESLKIWTDSSDFSWRVPRLYFTPEESNTLASIGNEINTYRDEQLTSFITGQQPMSQWDSFVDGLKKVKAEEVLEIRRAAYERAKNR